VHIDAALEFALNRYGFRNPIIENVNSGSNKVYRIRSDRRNYYLRISDKEYDYILAEIDWINYLAGSVRTPVLVKSNAGNTIETYSEGGVTVIICVFYEMAGALWDKNDALLWNETVFYNWGHTMGTMHRLTKTYRPDADGYWRPLFQNCLVRDDYYKDIPAVYDKIIRIKDEIRALPVDGDSYGLIHCDLDQMNILIDGDHIGVLDFDDCKYGWFALDIGIALYHALWWGLPDDASARHAFALKIIKHFLRGYNDKNRLSEFWYKKILLFMQYRQIDALSWHLNYFKPANYNVVVYNDLFRVYYDFSQQIKYIENDIFYDSCAINENDFVI